jgi:hypothetical protein
MRCRPVRGAAAVFRVTLTESAVRSGRYASRSWAVVKAVDWLDCGEVVYFFGWDGSGWHTILRVPAEDVALVVEI